MCLEYFEFLWCTADKSVWRVFMLKAKSQVTLELDFNLHEAYVFVGFHLSLQENLVEILVNLLIFFGADKYYFIRISLCSIDTIVRLVHILASININSLHKLHI